MSLTRLLTDSVTVVRPTPHDTDYGRSSTWADVGGPYPAKLHLQASQETQLGRDTELSFRSCTISGWPDVRAADRLRDQHGRVFPIEGEPDFQQNPSGLLKITVLRLRSTVDL